MYIKKIKGGAVIKNEENPKLNGIYQDIAEELGIDVAEVIYVKYGGGTDCIP